jgi:hypothetical protein
LNSSNHAKGNPLGMQPLEHKDMYVLPSQLCSQKRSDFISRGNRILGSYTAIVACGNLGNEFVESQARTGKFNELTPMRLTINERTLQTTYRQIKNLYRKGCPQLVNYIFLMIYGNFEAFLADSVNDGLTAQKHLTPTEETIRLTMAAKWLGKIDRISQRFDIDLGKRIRTKKFTELKMEFQNTVYKDPIDFLQKMADVRHRLIHSSGRVDSLFLGEFPNCGLSEGDLIELPPSIPYDVHFFFVLLTDLIDEAFSMKFSWSRTKISPEALT